MKQSLSNLLNNQFKNAFDRISGKMLILVVLIFVCFVVTFQNILSGDNHWWGGTYTYYNNYVIFKHSFLNLLHNTNLYVLHKEHADYFKYSPTFAMLMGAFAYLPDSVGLLIWNLLNVLLLFYALLSIKNTFSVNITYVLLFLLPELILSTQNSQCNTLLAGLLIFAYALLEKNKPAGAAFLIVLGAFVKLFSIFGVLLLLFYPKKVRSFSFVLLWSVLLFVLPLLLVSPQQLVSQYLNWGQLLLNDHSESLGMSIYQYVHFFTDYSNKIVLLLFGLFVPLIPLFFLRSHSSPYFRFSYLSMLLIWLVVFNHKAESPSYIIALTGCAIWGFAQKNTKAKYIYLSITFVLTSLVSTDLIPNYFKGQYLNLDLIKPLMPIISLGLIFFSMRKMGIRSSESDIQQNS